MRNLFLYITHSLSSKLSLGILGVVLTVFAVSLSFLFLRSRQIVSQEVTQHATHILQNTSLRVTKYLKEVEAATENISWLVLENPQPDSLFQYSRRVVELNPNINGCSITMEPGFFPQMNHNFSVYTIREDLLIETEVENEYDYYEKVWYKTPLEQKKACWVAPYNDFNEGTLSSPFMIASYSKPLYTQEGSLIGVISTDLSIQKLSEAVSAEKPYPNAYCTMVGPDGRYFVHTNRSKLIKESIFTAYNEKQHPDIIAMGKAMTAGETGSMHVRIDGAACLVFYQPVAGTDWSIALICPESDVFAVYKTLTYVLVPLLLVGLLLMFLFCWTTVKHFIKPLNQLVQQAHHIANGKFDTHIGHSDREDAIGKLQNSIAAILESINKHVADVQKMNEATEHSNEELAKANQMEKEAEQRKAESIREASRHIRTPLNIIGGFVQVMRNDYDSLTPQELEASTEAMKQKTITIRRMAHMLYDASRTDSHQLDCSQQVDVNTVIADSIHSFKEIEPCDMVLNYTSHLSTPHYIHTNSLYLHRSLRELLINAKKFAAPNPVDLTVDATDETIRFVIEDHGPGIPKEEQERVFEPFYKINNFTEGFGIGMGLSRQHITNLGGTLILDPDYTGGVRLVVEIPNK